jgi:hypothetical protein
MNFYINAKFNSACKTRSTEISDNQVLQAKNTVQNNVYIGVLQEILTP